MQLQKSAVHSILLGLTLTLLAGCSDVQQSTVQPTIVPLRAGVQLGQMNALSAGGLTAVKQMSNSADVINPPFIAPVSLRVLTPGFTDRSLRHRNSLAETSVVDSNSANGLKEDATWIMRNGLAGPNCYSFEARNFPNRFLRHSNFRLRTDLNDGSDLFKKDATFCSYLSPFGNGIAWTAFNFPDLYIRHFNGEGWMAKKGGTHVWDTAASFNEDTSWNVLTGWVSLP
jgi:Alpha-L-arabinofuranosidase B (ABFB) domain